MQQSVDPYELAVRESSGSFIPKSIPPPAFLGKGFDCKVLRFLYIALRVTKMSSQRRPYPRIWIVTPAFSALCHENGLVLRLLKLGDIERVFVQELTGQQLGTVRFIIKAKSQTNDPTQILELNEQDSPKELLRIVDALRRPQTDGETLPVTTVLPDEDVYSNQERYGEVNQSKLSAYVKPQQKVLQWDKSDEPASVLNKRWQAEQDTLQKKQSIEETPAQPAPLAPPRNPASEDVVSFAPGNAPNLNEALQTERRARAEAERRADRAEAAANTLAQQLTTAAQTESTQLRVTHLRTEGFDSAMTPCHVCQEPLAPFCAVTGLAHNRGELILTVFTSRLSQHATAVSRGGAAEYSTESWSPYILVSDRDILFSVVSGGVLLGKTGVLLRDALPPGRHETPASLWDPGVVVKLDGKGVGLLRLRAVEVKDRVNKPEVMRCTPKSGDCHVLCKLPCGEPVGIVARGEKLVIEERVDRQLEEWGRVEDKWVLIRDVYGFHYMTTTARSLEVKTMAAVCAGLAILTAASHAASLGLRSLSSVNQHITHMQQDINTLEHNTLLKQTALEAVEVTLHPGPVLPAYRHNTPTVVHAAIEEIVPDAYPSVHPLGGVKREVKKVARFDDGEGGGGGGGAGVGSVGGGGGVDSVHPELQRHAAWERAQSLRTSHRGEPDTIFVTVTNVDAAPSPTFASLHTGDAFTPYTPV